ncbi:MYND-type domain-containing protein [Durusdinium trenchii]|uniref:MYND-type domain-containing protein n=1 Tax=Durusdinium trenchii TaxID=1381693 RepID=A0ABP0KDF8_9DINO
MAVIEACRLAEHYWNQRHLEVHILNAYGSAMADLGKYEEFLHRAHQVKSLELHFVVPRGQMYRSEEATGQLSLCQRCQALGREITCVVHEMPLLDFIEEEIRSSSDPPFLRIAYSPALARLPMGDPSDQWEAALKRLADLQDDALFVITERTFADMQADEERMEDCGFHCVVPSQNSNFPSPLTLFDEVRSDEEWVLSGAKL